MKKLLLLTLFLLFVKTSFAQLTSEAENSNERTCVTIGILQGGGSLIGVDLEYLLSPKIGIQGGAGFLGYGAGLNYHIKPGVRTSFVSLAYWHQGFKNTYTQSALGPTFVYRGKKWFTAQLGIGARIGKGPAYPAALKDAPPYMLMYSIGAYIAN